MSLEVYKDLGAVGYFFNKAIASGEYLSTPIDRYNNAVIKKDTETGEVYFEDSFTVKATVNGYPFFSFDSDLTNTYYINGIPLVVEAFFDVANLIAGFRYQISKEMIGYNIPNIGSHFATSNENFTVQFLRGSNGAIRRVYFGTEGGLVVDESWFFNKPTLFSKINNQYREYDDGWVNINGVYRQIESIHSKINGIWRKSE